MPQPRKRIATTRTFEHNITGFDEIRERIVTFASVTANKLRKQGSACQFITVFIRTNRHREDLKQYTGSITLRTDYPTNSSLILSRLAVAGLKKIWREGYAYKKAGIIVSELVPGNIRQLNLFIPHDRRHKKLMQALDTLNTRYGYDLVKLGGQDPKRTWKMKQAKLSPAYTTRLSDVMEVKIS
jgi:DNA polymerase V